MTFAGMPDGSEIWWEGFGSPDDPPVLLLAGRCQSGIWWEVGFCELLAGFGRYVVRYDHRDTGRSRTWPVGAPTYSGDDLAADPLGLLDALGIGSAHLVGFSMGGGIAQTIAIRSAERVRTLTLMSTSPAGDRDGLPAPTDAFLSAEEVPEPDWTDRDAVVDYRVDIERPGAGDRFDEERVHRLAALDVARANDVEAMLGNHALAADGTDLEAGLDAISAPTLVLHGTDDPLFPMGHAEALRDRIAGARLVALEGVGHELPPPALWDVVAGKIAAHTATRTGGELGTVLQFETRPQPPPT